MTPRSLLVLAPAAMAAAALAVPVSAAPVRAPQKDAAVAVQGFAFNPGAAKISLGGTVTWTFKDAVVHTATADTSGMNAPLFDSGNKSNNQTFAFTFTAAGSYPYHCSIHMTMTGSVSVPMKFKPKQGGTGTSYLITWATVPAATGFVYDVQIKRPGAAAFVAFQTGVTAPSAPFHPDAGTGSYL